MFYVHVPPCVSVGTVAHCWRKRVQQLKKNVKSHVFWILKKNVKNVKKRTYSLTGHLIYFYYYFYYLR